MVLVGGSTMQVHRLRGVVIRRDDVSAAIFWTISSMVKKNAAQGQNSVSWNSHGVYMTEHHVCSESAVQVSKLCANGTLGSCCACATVCYRVCATRHYT